MKRKFSVTPSSYREEILGIPVVNKQEELKKEELEHNKQELKKEELEHNKEELKLQRKARLKILNKFM